MQNKISSKILSQRNITHFFFNKNNTSLSPLIFNVQFHSISPVLNTLSSSKIFNFPFHSHTQWIFFPVYIRVPNISPPSPKNSRPFVRLVHEGHIRGWNTLESCQPTNFRVQGKIPLRTWSEESLGNGGFAGGNETLSPLPHVTLHSSTKHA